MATVKKNQPEVRELPVLPAGAAEGDVGTFVSTVEAIGGAVYIVAGMSRINTILRERFPEARRIVNVIADARGSIGDMRGSIAETAGSIGDMPGSIGDPHSLENVDLAVLPAHFGVAENGACWITETQMGERALPFIAQHLALVLPKSAIVPDMHTAYERIAALDAGEPYGFATFIAGPSKTADIEQSLVLGAHGPASLTVFLVDEQQSDAGYY